MLESVPRGTGYLDSVRLGMNDVTCTPWKPHILHSYIKAVLREFVHIRNYLIRISCKLLLFSLQTYPMCETRLHLSAVLLLHKALRERVFRGVSSVTIQKKLSTRTFISQNSNTFRDFKLAVSEYYLHQRLFIYIEKQK